ncbi:hypothetical protein Misp02_03370 [Microtetraspora sp. NBRC 16547]|nr:hypothetical protein Misp02_03370 [Microtetraspora sp. NBRC 16547]
MLLSLTRPRARNLPQGRQTGSPVWGINNGRADWGMPFGAFDGAVRSLAPAT